MLTGRSWVNGPAVAAALARLVQPATKPILQTRMTCRQCLPLSNPISA